MNSPTYAAGASASINKTLQEIESIVAGSKLPRSGPMRAELRKQLQAALIEASKTWYRKGFNRGHREAYAAFAEDGEVPTRLSVRVEREFLPNTKLAVKATSTLTAKYLHSLEE